MVNPMLLLLACIVLVLAGQVRFAAAAQPSCAKCHQDVSLDWQQLPSLPDHEGFAAMFAGSSGGALVVGGGAKFPDKRPWEGGTKIWYDAAYVLETPAGPWKGGFKLPRPVAYGVSVTTPDGIICIGGGDAAQNFTDVYRLAWDGKQLSTAPLPPLPRPCAFMSGAMVGDTLYIAGGIEKPDSTACLQTLWALDLKSADPRWTELPPCPGPARMLAVAAGTKKSFYLFSGTSLSAGPDGKPVRQYLRDAWRYSAKTGWKKLADLPRAAVAAPSPAIQAHRSLLVMTGDDGLNVNFEPKTQHPGFPRTVLAYELAEDKWTELPQQGPLSRATVPTTIWNGRAIIPSGEARPGYRSPEVWSLQGR